MLYFLKPGGEEITAQTIIIYNSDGTITVCQNLLEYMHYADDLRDRDNR